MTVSRRDFIALSGAAACTGTLMDNSASAEGAPTLHEGPWPIRNGHNYQPTEHELKTLHLEDVTPDQAREIDRLYNELLASSPRAQRAKVN